MTSSSPLTLRKTFLVAVLGMLSAGSMVFAQTSTSSASQDKDKDKTTKAGPAVDPATAKGPAAPPTATAASPNPNENFPSNPNVNPLPGQKYNAKGIANSEGESGSSKSPLERVDQTFLTETYDRTAEEYKIAKLVLSKATNADLKAFADKRVKAYEKLSQDLDAIDKDKHMGLIDSKNEHAFDALSKKSGADFDVAFLKYDHAEMKKAIERVQKFADNGKDAAVKAFAAKLLPQYQENDRYTSELLFTLKK